MISKILLEEILGFKVLDFYTTDYYLYYSLIGCRAVDDCEEAEETINIYELAYKSKKWAFRKGWLFQVRTGSTLSAIDIFNSKNQELSMRTQITADSEPEAIFKASEWVLKEEQNKCI